MNILTLLFLHMGIAVVLLRCSMVLLLFCDNYIYKSKLHVISFVRIYYQVLLFNNFSSAMNVGSYRAIVMQKIWP